MPLWRRYEVFSEKTIHKEVRNQANRKMNVMAPEKPECIDPSRLFLFPKHIIFVVAGNLSGLWALKTVVF